MKLVALKTFEFGGRFQNWKSKEFIKGECYDLPMGEKEVLDLISRGCFVKESLVEVNKKVSEKKDKQVKITESKKAPVVKNKKIEFTSNKKV